MLVNNSCFINCHRSSTEYPDYINHIWSVHLKYERDGMIWKADQYYNTKDAVIE